MLRGNPILRYACVYVDIWASAIRGLGATCSQCGVPAFYWKAIKPMCIWLLTRSGDSDRLGFWAKTCKLLHTHERTHTRTHARTHTKRTRTHARTHTHRNHPAVRARLRVRVRTHAHARRYKAARVIGKGWGVWGVGTRDNIYIYIYSKMLKVRCVTK